ncbi:MAG: helix-turn-helix domain-containing protein [Candidatus Binatia bacterium]
MLRNKFVTEGQLQQELLRRTKTTQAEIAREIGVAPPAISNVINGVIPPHGKILKWLGYRRRVVYEKIQADQKV